jgi:hypothetical protein
VSIPPRSNHDEKPSRRVDDFMSDDDLTAAAMRVKLSADWSRLPKLDAIFAERPPQNIYWHELVALTLTSLEVNGEAMNRRNAAARVPVAVQREIPGAEIHLAEYMNRRNAAARADGCRLTLRKAVQDAILTLAADTGLDVETVLRRVYGAQT